MDSAMFSLGVTKVLSITPEFSVVCHPHAYKVGYQGQIADVEQAQEFRNFVENCRKDMLLFDIGAHFGFFSLAAAAAGGKAIAVDPSPIATRMTKTQASLNHCLDRITIVCAGVSENSGEMDMLASGVFSDGYFMVSPGRPATEFTPTPATTVDDMTVRFGAPTHLKIDVEGHEAAVLRGARTTLMSFAPLLFLELHNEIVTSLRGDPNAPLDILSELGYATFALDGAAIPRKAILARPIVRIVARRTGGTAMNWKQEDFDESDPKLARSPGNGKGLLARNGPE